MEAVSPVRGEEFPLQPRFIALCTLLAALLAPPPALASTLPRADFRARPVLGIGGGQAIGLAFDAAIDEQLAFGAAIGSRAWLGANASARVLYRFWQAGRDPLSVCALLGAQAAGPAFQTLTEVEPVAGLVAAYPITPEWTVRAVLAAGLFGNELLRPAGIEVAYRFHPRLEVTIGFNGRGDLAGLKLDL